MSGGKHPNLRRKKKWVFIGFGVVLALIVAFAVVLMVDWPFTAEKVAHDLGDAIASKVEFQKYRSVYFPHSGAIAEGVVFRHGNITTPLITIDRLTIRATYLGLITRHVAVLRAEGMRVVLPPFGTDGSWSNNSTTTVIDEFIANKSLLVVPATEPGKRDLQFQVHEFTVHNLGAHHAMDYRTVLTNATPPGEIRSEGKIGPWKTGNGGETAVVGAYTFDHANLGVFEGISGILSSKGSFQGTFNELRVEGSTTTPDFAVKESGHQHQLDTNFRASVNTTNGDVLLHGVNARLDKTMLVAQGSVAGTKGQKGKTTSLDIVVSKGRIQDLMLLFVSEKKSPLNGEISFHATTQIPPGKVAFLKKVRLQGEFGVDAAHFTSPKTQQSMNKLSVSARGDPENEDPSRVMSDLKGHVEVRNGAADFTNLFFDVPGAAVEMHGTFGLISQRIDLHGIMRMQAKPSKATTGLKSFLMKVIDPFTNKDRSRAPIPVSITGTYHNPKYSAGTPK